MKIHWIGNTEFWNTPPVAKEPAFAMALCEEAVLQTAFSPLFANLRRLSPLAALNCTSRYHTRVALDGSPWAHLNPRWAPLPAWYDRGVVKAPASCSNAGVFHVRTNPYAEQLKLYLEKPPAIIEEFVDGWQWEQDGFVLANQAYFFNPLLQVWEENRIVEYRKPKAGVPVPLGLQDAVQQVLSAVQLTDSPFCVELRASPSGWKLIEVHARLGEDVGLPELLADKDPLKIIEEVAKSAVSVVELG